MSLGYAFWNALYAVASLHKTVAGQPETYLFRCRASDGNVSRLLIHFSGVLRSFIPSRSRVTREKIDLSDVYRTVKTFSNGWIGDTNGRRILYDGYSDML